MSRPGRGGFLRRGDATLVQEAVFEVVKEKV